MATFYKLLPERANLQIDKAVLIASYAKQIEGVTAITVREICDRFELAHLARPNSTILSGRLQSDRRVSMRSGQVKALHRADDFLKELIPEALESAATDEGKAPRIDTKLLANAPFIDTAYLDDLRELLSLYEALHVLENSIRRFIQAVLQQKLGVSWWESAASASMKRKHQDRLEKEQKRKWLPARASLGPLYSIDWSDLIALMRKYELDFLPFIGEFDFLHRFSDLGLLRHVIAHHGFVDDPSEVQRIALALRDWNNQVGTAVKATAAK